MLLTTLLHTHFRGVPPLWQTQSSQNAHYSRALAWFSPIFTYTANGQFPPPYPLKHSFSLPIYSTLKIPECVTPNFRKCNPYL